MLNARQKQNVRNSTNRSFLLLLKNNAFLIMAIILILIFVVPYIKRYLDTAKAKKEQNDIKNNVNVNAVENASQDPNVIDKKATTIKKKYPLVSDELYKTLKSSAYAISKALGTDVENNHRNEYVDIFNVSGWTEDEEKVIQILKKHTGTYPVLQDLYYGLYTKSRSLNSDLLKYLSDSDLSKVRKNMLPYKFI